MTLTTEGDALADWETLGDPLTVLDTDVEALIVFDTCGDLDTVTELEVKAEPDVVEVAARCGLPTVGKLAAQVTGSDQVGQCRTRHVTVPTHADDHAHLIGEESHPLRVSRQRTRHRRRHRTEPRNYPRS